MRVSSNPDRDAKIADLYRNGDQTYDAIASALDLPVNVVKGVVQRAINLGIVSRRHRKGKGTFTPYDRRYVKIRSMIRGTDAS